MIVYQFCRLNEWLPRNLHERVIYLNHPFNFNDPTENNFGLRSYSRKENSGAFLDKVFSVIYKNYLLPDWVRDEKSSISEDIKSKLSEDVIKSIFTKDLLDKNKTISSSSEVKSILRKPTGLEVENLDDLKGWEEEFLYKAVKTAQDSFRIACFTNCWHNSLMWGHYADGMRGVCIKYEIPDSDIHKVEYGNPYEVSTYNILTGKVEQEVERTFLRKNKDWSYENEFRIIRREDFYRIRKGAVKAIYFGYKCDSGKAKFVCDIAKASHGNDVNFLITRNSQVDHTLTSDEVQAGGLADKIKEVRDSMKKYRTFLDDKNVSELLAMLD